MDVVPSPALSLQAGLNCEQQQSRNPRDKREWNEQYRHLPEDIFGAVDRAAEVERQRVIAEIRRDQSWSRIGREDERQRALKRQECAEEIAVDGQQIVGIDTQQGKRAQIVMQVNHSRRKDRNDV